MSYDPPRPAGRLLLTPEDSEAPARTRRLHGLGFGERPEPALDAFADRLAELVGAPYAMVNFIGEERQFFAGLHVPAEAGTGRVAGADSDEVKPRVGRRLPRDHGFCPHVVVRRKALVLEDVRDYPRFAGNPVVDEFGIRSYLGAPLIDTAGMALGTVCVADFGPRPWGRAGLETIKAMAAELVGQLAPGEAPL
ncbi:GAF domain-containing protein [Streptomyces turgidiscabies]|uniref:GAF domain protein n=1 Tax=Streptomyces turgidiscabies (strain Car8) TaxID=698760 RepID=L7FEW7_STRT8|nr:MULTISPECIES: GAF domain-containing protein [Streptomyces]ELP69749.1 GAF domain protein [Streptomyces turgidiscabies Car8]MDX3491492.1 GAF domain-containing protein [Streptomyces turgidiscabies]GAQ73807.1 GAF domain protein [Streptomyces turgidiscabies]